MAKKKHKNNSPVRANRLQHETKPVPVESKKTLINGSADNTVAPEASPEEVRNRPQSLREETDTPKHETAEENDSIVSLDELAVLINKSHEKAKKMDEEALRCAWDAGNWLELAYKRIMAENGYGGWGTYLAENCPVLSRTTVWRYRKVATCFTVKQLPGMTLSEAYAKMDVAKFEEESIAADVQTEPTGPKKQPAIVKLLKTLVTASKHFDEPATLPKRDKTSIKKALLKLEQVHSANAGPSILAVTWRDKLDKDVTDWSEDEVELFETDYAKLKAVYKKVQAIKEDK